MQHLVIRVVVHPKLVKLSGAAETSVSTSPMMGLLLGAKAGEDEIAHYLLLGGTDKNIKMLQTIQNTLKLSKSFFPLLFSKIFHYSKLQRVHLICWYVFDCIHQEFT